MRFGDSWDQSMDNLVESSVRKRSRWIRMTLRRASCLAYYYQYVERLRPSGSRALIKALDLNPNNADVLLPQSIILLQAGQPESGPGLG